MTIALLLTAALAAAAPAPAALSAASSAAPAPARVVLILIDGVRWQDVFDAEGSKFASAAPARPALPRLHRLAASEGALWGDKRKGSSARTISKVPYSLPGYQSIFTGQQTACENNKCANVDRATFFDRYAAPDDAAAFCSWAGLGNAVAVDPKQLHADIPPWGEAEVGPPWENARWDSATWARAMTYVRSDDPHLLVVSLLDTDEWAHEGHEDGYRAALVFADARIGDLVDDLKRRDVWKDTTLIVSTDHGRNADWRRHGDDDAGRDVFVGVFGRRAPRLGAAAPGTVTHADLRPTIEDALGLAPTPSAGRSLLVAP